MIQQGPLLVLENILYIYFSIAEIKNFFFGTSFLGTHSAFQESLGDLERQRDETIEDALVFQEYQMEVVKEDYGQEVERVEGEYNNERQGLMGVLLQMIEEKRKQVMLRGEEEDTVDIFRDAYKKLNYGKRNLRNVVGGRNSQSRSPSRHQERRSRRDRQATPHNIHAQPTSIEQEALEADFNSMKGMYSSTAAHNSHSTRKQR
ncbi:MAG: hypothetical protein EXX96DRAFT_117403 [Benjaminiella poitrasii]|nr:MAG: hypothetical protein EXX96DRAFT_117403 [Benjaminiella poitrasii]